MKRIGLVGFSGSGKSSIAQLAKVSGYRTVDTDSLIMERYGLEQFEKIVDGDDVGFRAVESEMISEALMSDSEIVAFGGGFHLEHEAIEKVRTDGIRLVCLRSSFDTIINRVGDRPLLKKLGMKGYRDLFEQRKQLYAECADFTVDTGERPINEIWFEVERIWNLIFQ